MTEEEARQAIGSPNYTVAEIVTKFLAQPMTDGTRRYYTRPLDALKAKLGYLKVTDLKPFHIMELDVSSLKRAAKTCFHWAEQQEYIEHSPLRNLKVPAAKARGDWTYLSPDQWNALLRRLPADMLDLVVVMKETGCRPQEARKVETRHFNRVGQCWVFPREESKGKRESRVVHLSDTAYEICLRLSLKYPNGPLFRNSQGKSWSTAALVGRFDRLSKRLGFKVIAYTLRHTFATEAIMRGVDLITLAALLGHRNLKMLSAHYAHIQRRSAHVKEGLRKAVG